ncbi:MAG: M56 family metallopeptidase, partial [Planctomycetota bacterium]
MSPLRMLDSTFCLHLTLTLCHFLWQGFAIGVPAVVAAWCMRRCSARSRCRIHVGALLLMAACLPVTFALVRDAEVGPTPSRPAATATVPLDAPVARAPVVPPIEVLEPSAVRQPPESRAVVEAGPAAPVREPIVAADLAPVPPAARSAVPDHSRTASGVQEPNRRLLARCAATVYLLGVLVMFVRLLLALGGGQRLRRDAVPVEDRALLAAVRTQAEQLGLRLAPVVGYCRRVAVPVVVGVLKPAILLPVSLASGLSPKQITVVVTHELIHIRRRDHLVNLLQRMIEAALFFHPAVWYVSRQIAVEREHCCDDLVVAGGEEPARYAELLVRMGELSDRAARRVPAAAVAVSGGRPSRLRMRILRLVDGSRDPQFRLTGIGALAVTITLAAGIAAPVLVGGWAAPAGAGQPLKARLADAVTVELVGVAEHPSGGRQWWNPDGTPLAEPPYDEFGGAAVPAHGGQAYEFALRVSGLPKDRGSRWTMIPDP